MKGVLTWLGLTTRANTDGLYMGRCKRSVIPTSKGLLTTMLLVRDGGVRWRYFKEPEVGQAKYFDLQCDFTSGVTASSKTWLPVSGEGPDPCGWPGRFSGDTRAVAVSSFLETGEESMGPKLPFCFNLSIGEDITHSFPNIVPSRLDGSHNN